MTRTLLAVELTALDNGRYCLGNLADFGEIVYLYKSVPNMWSSSFEGDVLAQCEQKNFDPDLDFFAVSGIMPLAVLILGTLVDEYGAIKTLLWDRENHKYREKIIGGLEQ